MFAKPVVKLEEWDWSLCLDVGLKFLDILILIDIVIVFCISTVVPDEALPA
jgi:hypothetical protein